MDAQTIQECVISINNASIPYDFRESNLYLYKCYVFQYVEPNITRYRKRFNINYYKLLRICVSLLIWCCLLFESFNFINGFNEFVERMSTFKAIMATLHRIIWMVRYVFLHNVGVYLFSKHPYKIEQELEEIFKQFDEEEEVEKVLVRIKKAERRCENFMVALVIILIIFPLVQKIVPIVIERKLNLTQEWDKTIECFEFFIILFTRIVSMPFFVNFIFLSYLQRIRIDGFSEKLDLNNNKNNKNNCCISNSYVDLHKSIRKSSSDFHLYVVCLLTLLILWGALGAYSIMEIIRTLKDRAHLSVYPIILSEFVGTTLIFCSETAFLYVVPLVTLGKVAFAQKQVVPNILMLPWKGSEKELIDIAGRVEKLQQTQGVGYTIFDTPLTKLKTAWLTLLGPIIIVLAKVLLTERFTI